MSSRSLRILVMLSLASLPGSWSLTRGSLICVLHLHVAVMDRLKAPNPSRQKSQLDERQIERTYHLDLFLRMAMNREMLVPAMAMDCLTVGNNSLILPDMD